jgi:hypothetical protein
VVVDKRELKRVSLAFAAALSILAAAPDLKDPRAYLQAAIALIGTYWRPGSTPRRRKKEETNAQAANRP